MAKYIDLDQGSESNYSEKNISVSEDYDDIPNYKKCVNCCQPGKWRKCTKYSICDECKLLPEYHLICRSNVYKRFPHHYKKLLVEDMSGKELVENDIDIEKVGLTFEDLHNAYMVKKIHMFTVPYDRSSSQPMRLYFEAEVQKLVEDKRKRLQNKINRHLNKQ